MYCMQCGADLLKGAKFCSKCGATVHSARAADAARPSRRRAPKRALISAGVGAVTVGILVTVIVLLVDPFASPGAGGGAPDDAAASGAAMFGQTPAAPADVATPAPTAVPTPAPTPIAKIIFLRPKTAGSIFGRSYGTLFMADADGSNVTELAPDEAMSSFVGFGTAGNDSVLYYMSWGLVGDVVLRKRNLRTLEVSDLTTIKAPDKTGAPPIGDLSPDGQYIAFHHAEGIDLLDLSSGDRRRLVSSEDAGCYSPEIDLQRCWGFYRPTWSPDGMYLVARQVFFEGGEDVLINPSDENETFSSLNARNASWTPAFDKLCHVGGGTLYEPPNLYVRAFPDGSSELVLEVDADPDRLPNMSIGGCVWMDQDRLVFSVTGGLSGGPFTLATIMSDGSGYREVIRLDDPYSLRSFFKLNDTQVIVNVDDQTSGPNPSPRLVDITSGATTEVLGAGSEVVGVEWVARSIP